MNRLKLLAAQIYYGIKIALWIPWFVAKVLWQDPWFIFEAIRTKARNIK